MLHAGVPAAGTVASSRVRNPLDLQCVGLDKVEANHVKRAVSQDGSIREINSNEFLGYLCSERLRGALLGECLGVVFVKPFLGL